MVRIPHDASDVELIYRLRDGQQDALKLLYERYSGLVYTLAVKILGQSTEAEDLTQEVFINFWRRGNYDYTRATLGTYLCVLARSLALNRMKGRGSRQSALERLQVSSIPELTRFSPLEQASLTEQEQTLQSALSQLSDKQRQVLEMNFYQGFSHAEISQQLGMPLGTVKSTARQGLLKLRKLLGKAVG